MTRRHKDFIIAVVTFLGGIYFFLEYLLPEEFYGIKIGANYENILNGVSVVGIMAIGLGLINIAQVHGTRILKTQKGWPNSLLLVVGLLIMLVVESLNLRNSESINSASKELAMLEQFSTRIATDYSSNTATALPAEKRAELLQKRIAAFEQQVASDDGIFRTSISKTGAEDKAKLLDMLLSAETAATAFRTQILAHAGKSEIDSSVDSIKGALQSALPIVQDFSVKTLDATTAARASEFFHKAFFESLGSAMFALLAFYIATAAYRAFRIRSLEGFIMMLAALVVILGQIPQGPLYIWTGLPELRERLMKYVSTPSFRAIFFGSTIAGLAMAVRMWLSLERSPLNSDTEQRGG